MKIALLSATLVLSIAPAMPAQTTAAEQQPAASQSRHVDQVDRTAQERAKTATRDRANMDGAVARDTQANSAAAENPGANQSANTAADQNSAATTENAAESGRTAPQEVKSSNYGLWGLLGLLGLFGLGRKRRAVSRRSDYEGQNFRRVA